VTSRSDEIVRRARSLIGAPFRPQGRSRDGIDCVGVAAFALDLPDGAVRRDYGLRGTPVEALVAALRELGLAEAEKAEPGDIALFAPGPAQLHLAVVTEGGLVHADLGLGFVVERPLPAPWPQLGLWRLRDQQEVERWQP
jgi:murein DD-endopeptidase / murein LD-carboxypeptidase